MVLPYGLLKLKPELAWLGKSRAGAVDSVVGSAPVLPPNAFRKIATFVNNSANWIYLSKTINDAVVNSGIPLAPNGGAYEINLTNPYYGPISMACGAVAVAALCWTEDE